MSANLYILTARLEGTGTSRFTFWAESDYNATFEAIGEILTRAHKSTIWAKGSIELTNPKREVIHTMEAKTD